MTQKSPSKPALNARLILLLLLFLQISDNVIWFDDWMPRFENLKTHGFLSLIWNGYEAAAYLQDFPINRFWCGLNKKNMEDVHIKANKSILSLWYFVIGHARSHDATFSGKVGYANSCDCWICHRASCMPLTHVSKSHRFTGK